MGPCRNFKEYLKEVLNFLEVSKFHVELRKLKVGKYFYSCFI